MLEKSFVWLNPNAQKMLSIAWKLESPSMIKQSLGLIYKLFSIASYNTLNAVEKSEHLKGQVVWWLNFGGTAM